MFINTKIIRSLINWKINDDISKEIDEDITVSS